MERGKILTKEQQATILYMHRRQKASPKAISIEIDKSLTVVKNFLRSPDDIWEEELRFEKAENYRARGEMLNSRGNKI